MKKLALAIALLGTFGTAQAGLYVNPSSDFSISNYGLTPNTTGPETRGTFGNLFTNEAGSLTFTYLGQESDNTNKFSLNVGNSEGVKSFYDIGNGYGANVGDIIFDKYVSVGTIDFWFTDITNGKTVYNGSNDGKGYVNFAFLGNNNSNGKFEYDHVTTKGTFDYIIGFNDKFKDGDYDDLVVGVKFTPKTPSAVPVPAALPLMATALGLFGFGASRRRI